MKRLLAVTILVAACGKGSGGDGKGGKGSGTDGKSGAGNDACAAAIAHMASLQASSLPANMPEEQKQKLVARVKRTSDAIVASCRATKWSDEVLACIRKLEALADGKQCDDKLTPEQREAVEKAAEEAQRPPAGDVQRPPDEEERAPASGAGGSAG